MKSVQAQIWDVKMQITKQCQIRIWSRVMDQIREQIMDRIWYDVWEEAVFQVRDQIEDLK